MIFSMLRTSESLRFRNDLYCVGWDVKPYSLALKVCWMSRCESQVHDTATSLDST